MALEIHVNVAVDVGAGAPLGYRDLTALLRRAAAAALRAEGVEDADLSLAVVDDAAIATLNARYLAHEGPTDVIAFGLAADEAASTGRVGDIYIGWDQALRQARALGVPAAEELARLAVHGTLHVLGHDHPEGEERERSAMWERQEAILREVVGP